MATQKQAIELCERIEAVAPKFGCHVALTGGTLYKDGPRKDIDIILYRIRQVGKIDEIGLFSALESIGLKKISGGGWCHKAIYQDIKIDMFFPESKDGDYDV